MNWLTDIQKRVEDVGEKLAEAADAAASVGEELGEDELGLSRAINRALVATSASFLSCFVGEARMDPKIDRIDVALAEARYLHTMIEIASRQKGISSPAEAIASTAELVASLEALRSKMGRRS